MTRVLVGFALGYALSAKMTSGGYEELRRAWQTISESEEFRGAVASARAFVEDAVSQGSGRLRALAASGGDLAGPLRGLVDVRDVRAIWSRISER